MRALLTIRPLAGEPFPLVVEEDRFVAPDGPIDRELDTGSWYALPGLADCHAHLAASDLDGMLSAERPDPPGVARRHAWAQVEGGVLLVADKGSRDDLALQVLEAPPHGRPELQMAGRVIASPGGYYPGFADEVDEEGLAAALGRAAGLASWVKLIGDWPRRGVGTVPNFSEEGLAAAVRVAHATGRRVAIHAAARDTPGMAVRAGVDSIEHGLFLTGDDLAALGARGGAWVPTIANMERVRDMLGVDSSGGRLIAEGLENVRELLGGAPAAGAAVLAGSDLCLPHGKVAREASKLVEYGLSPERALEAVTTAAYHYLGVGYGFRPGLPADAVFVEGDPREDVTRLESPAMVMRLGRVVAGR
ncbi:MAG: amidohydrolase family protein [Acidimicrobiia bacterium]